jgi:hypothetical protein
VVRDVLAWSRQESDWRKVWHLIEEKWDRNDPCPEGALRPFNIDAKLNGAYVVLGLLYGRGDMGQTLEISTRAGQDSDCNPSTAGGILGTMLGYEAIADVWKSGIPAIADRKFAYTDYTFHTIVDSTVRRAEAEIVAHGGRIDGDQVRIAVQPAQEVALAVWDDYGAPRERIAASDARWQFHGDWSIDPQSQFRTSSTAGAEAMIRFSGTGFAAVGPLMPNGGTFDAYLDGIWLGGGDAYSDEDSVKSSESLLHRWALSNGEHTLRLVVRGIPFPGSTGAAVTVQDLIVYR